MMLEQLVLQNFGLYAGRTVLRLAPPSPEQPVVLVGGMNGAGKTTLLEALQLALYGKLAETSKRAGKPYQEYLASTLHRGTSPQEGASVEVTFRIVHEGAERSFQVIRAWGRSRQGIKEKLLVLRDGKSDPHLAETWAEFMEGLLPVRLSHLFFFDGEQVERLADPTSSAELLSTAIHSLLGLDLVDQLAQDLQALERRRKLRESSSDRQELEKTLTAERTALEQRREVLLQERAAQHNTVELLTRRAQDVEARFRAEGGQQFTRRTELEAEKKRLQTQLEQVNERLRTLASEASPLLLLRPMLERIQVQAEQEQQAQRAQLLTELLKSRDQALLEAVADDQAHAPLVPALRIWLEQDRAQRTQAAQLRPYLSMEGEGTLLLGQLLNTELHTLREHSASSLHAESRLREQLFQNQRVLDSIPSEDAIAGILKERQSLQEALDAAGRKRIALDEALEQVDRELAHIQNRLTRALLDLTDERLSSFETTQFLKHAERVRGTLQTFRASLLERKVRRIEEAILESYQLLLHKDSLIHALKIDTRTFVLTLIDPSGKALASEQLSAGERQLLAVSILWGLAKASRRNLAARQVYAISGCSSPQWPWLNELWGRRSPSRACTEGRGLSLSSLRQSSICRREQAGCCCGS